MHRFFILVVAGTAASAAAFADDHARLRGTYAFTGTSLCIRDPASLGFNPNFTPKGGPIKLFSYTVEGVLVFRADDTGTSNSRAYSVDTGGGETSDSSYQFTYAIGPDGKLSVQAVPGTNKITILIGPNAGLTQAVDVPDTSGFIGENARAIILAPPVPTVQTVTRSNGTQLARICNGSLIVTRVSDDDR
jgi:hypothetical protein